jgi:type II secretory pathway pseudopilin PulG
MTRHARPARRHTRRRAFSLIEAVMVVLVLAICVPPTLNFMQQSAQERADTVAIARATALAQCVMEHVQADVASDDSALGYAALANASTYLSSPSTGLYARLSTHVLPYSNAGLTYTVSIGSQVSSTGAATGNASQDLFRLVTVNVSAPSSRTSTPLAFSASCMVADL